VAVYAVLSTTVDATTVVDSSARVIGPDGKTSSLSVILSQATFSEGGEQAARTILTFNLPQPLPDGDYSLVVGPGIVSTLGRRFDQDPSTPAEDGFVSRFTVLIPNSHGCETGYVRDETLGGCVPVPTCPASCVTGFVCDLVAQACVESCKYFGVCDPDTKTCDPQTWLCH
jgi:hypothetical protein